MSDDDEGESEYVSVCMVCGHATSSIGVDVEQLTKDTHFRDAEHWFSSYADSHARNCIALEQDAGPDVVEVVVRELDDYESDVPLAEQDGEEIYRATTQGNDTRERVLAGGAG